jgi:hypothetical protein
MLIVIDISFKSREGLLPCDDHAGIQLRRATEGIVDLSNR